MKKQKKIVFEIPCVLMLVMLIIFGLLSVEIPVSADSIIINNDLSEQENVTQKTSIVPPVLETLYVQSRSLAVRPAKNSTVLLGKLTGGTKVTGYREGAWIRITYNGKTAYIAAKHTDTKPVLETL
ncbi:MAG: SH3 domain-containing protein, partial [Clostridiaceae bacterium]|nr:SH3 domain-containing protein [Clostridiaceae bacterium]